MEIITVTSDNIAEEHICCALSHNDDCQIRAKKAWLRDRFADGLVFMKGNMRGKCFIEYIPAENAWVPLEADDYMYINCFWVAGKYKGQGYSNLLLNACIADAKQKGKQGLVTLSAKKKLPYLADPKYLQYKGFKKADEFGPCFELQYFPIGKIAKPPKFKINSQNSNKINNATGFTLYYTNQCPFTAKYVPIIESVARAKQLDFKVIKISTTQEAQNAPTPFTSFSLFYKGKFVTHEILSENKFLKIINSMGL